MASPVWKGSIVVSLISIPVRIYAAARSERTSLLQIHSVCHTRLRQPLYCPHCKRMVERNEVIKGFEFEKGQYVLFDNNELKKLVERSSPTLEISSFTKMSEIDPIYYDASYFCVPEESGKKVYRLLVKALEDTQTIGLGRLLMHQRDYTVFLRPYERGIALHTMYFQNEIRRLPEFERTEADGLKAQELKLTEQLIDMMVEPFDAAKYHDEYQTKLNELIEAKRQGKTIEVEEEAPRAPVVDLMTALKRSVEAKMSGAGPKKAPAASASKGRKTARPTPIRKVG
jgi:DNA end-binding protein Ku